MRKTSLNCLYELAQKYYTHAKIHKINKLDKSQEEIAGQICDLIVANEEPKNWNKLV